MPCDETIIFDSCLEWAKKKVKKVGLEVNGKHLRAQLGDCFSLIRFAAMSIDDIAKRTVTYSDLFGGYEWADLIHSKMIEGYVSRFFPRKKRFWWNPKATQCYITRSEVIHVTSNRSTLLGGVYGAPLTHCNGFLFNVDAIIKITEIRGKSFDSAGGTTMYRETMKFG